MSSEEVTKNRLGARFWIILVVILVLLLGTAGGGLFYYFSKKEPAAEKKMAIHNIPMGSFTVNLKDNNYKRYLRMELTLETTDKKLIKEVAEQDHRVRDLIIDELSDRTVADLEDREVLKSELISSLNDILTTGKIKGIYFSQFMIQ